MEPLVGNLGTEISSRPCHMKIIVDQFHGLRSRARSPGHHLDSHPTSTSRTHRIHGSSLVFIRLICNTRFAKRRYHNLCPTVPIWTMSWKYGEENSSQVRHQLWWIHLQPLYIRAWGSYVNLASSMVLCDRAFIRDYPQIMGDTGKVGDNKSLSHFVVSDRLLSFQIWIPCFTDTNLNLNSNITSRMIFKFK